MVPELKKSFFLLCDIIITFLVLEPATRWSIEISFPTVAMAVSSLDLEALWYKHKMLGCASQMETGMAHEMIIKDDLRLEHFSYSR